MAINRQRAAQELLARRAARNNIIDYAQTISVPGRPVEETDDDCSEQMIAIEAPLAEHHKLILNAIDECSQTPYGRLMIFMPPGSAKALALDTPIPTPEGWCNIGDLKIGDKVFDENGDVCNVTWVSQVWKNRPVYKVKTDCGDEIIADEKHEWLVRLCGKRLVFKLKETWQLDKTRAKRPMIKKAEALNLPDVSLPIEPYLLGVWLGDGHSAGMRITSSVEDQPWLIGELHRLGYSTSSSKRQETLFSVLGVRKLFVELDLINDPEHKTYGRKHIPSIYLRASQQQRLHLLQGLIDTDGTVCKKRGCSTFCNTNLELAQQVRELVRSLGVKAGWSESRAILNGKDCGIAYKVSFYLENSARMPRKAMYCRNQKRTPNTYIDVSYSEVADTVCIEVDSKSHLFLAGKSMTPTHNSTYASVVFPSYYLGKNPNSPLILASYNTGLAKKIGRKIRSIIKQLKYKAIHGTQLKNDSRAAHDFELENKSSFMAAGLLAGITGNRAKGFIIDDPVRSRKDANSKPIMDSIYNEYADSVRTRLLPKGFVVLIQTRWSLNDLAGRILPTSWNGESGNILCQDGMTWRVLCLQARCENDTDPLGRQRGEYLWPDWFDEIHWRQLEAVPRTWFALCQQLPRVEAGNFFKPEKMPVIDKKALPNRLQFVRAWDLASTEGDGDYTVGVLLAYDHKSGHSYIMDVVRGQWSPDDVYTTIKNTALMDGSHVKIRLPQDPGQAGKSQKNSFMRLLRGYSLFIDSVSGSKDTRATPLAAQSNLGNVSIVNGDWNYVFIDELRNFDPDSTNQTDDQVDAASDAFNHFNRQKIGFM